MKFSHDSQGVLFDGRREFLLSGEMHYFRVPRADWRKRMRLWKNADGNFISTYVPWLIHEPEEGRIIVGDRPERDLAGFLETAAEEGLPVMLRPGPYQYSELVCGGLPTWLLRDYPQLRWQRPDGSDRGPDSPVSYMHPLFLEKARRWFAAFAEVARPFMASRGGPVPLVQLDNELGGIHLWFGPPDANPETFGCGREEGRWPMWLARKYRSIDAANEAFGGTWRAFAEIPPLVETASDAPVGDERRRRDFFRCYLEQLRDYLCTLKGWLREDGISEPVCHNCGSVELTPIFAGTKEALGDDFLLGYDHYYSLGPAWKQENPTVGYALGTRFAVDTIAALGHPAVGMEIPGGSPSDVPPILREDLLACYMSHLAAGAKGLNLYVFTGGPNFGDTGDTCDIYDYNAAIRADGSLNETYFAMKDFGAFMAAHPELLRGQRAASVQIGFEWDTLRMGGWAPPEGGLSGERAQRFAEKGFVFALTATPFPAAWTELTEKALDPEKPLILPAPAMMSEKAQRAVVAFLEHGGRVLLAPDAPTRDLDLRPCTVLRDFLRLPERVAAAPGAGNAPLLVDGARIFGCATPKRVLSGGIPEGADTPMTNARTGEVFGWWQKAGRGEVCVFATTFDYSLFCQAEMLERMLARLGARPFIRSTNRNVPVESHLLEDGRLAAFALNLHSSPQTTTLLAPDGAAFATDVRLAPMEVRLVTARSLSNRKDTEARVPFYDRLTLSFS